MENKFVKFLILAVQPGYWKYCGVTEIKMYLDCRHPVSDHRRPKPIREYYSYATICSWERTEYLSGRTTDSEIVYTGDLNIHQVHWLCDSKADIYHSTENSNAVGCHFPMDCRIPQFFKRDCLPGSIVS